MLSPTVLTLLYPALLATIATNENYTLFSDESGVPYIVDLDAPELTLQDIKLLAANLDEVKFTLYTRSYPTLGEELKHLDENTIKNSKWNPKHPTRFITHGWRAGGNSAACTSIRNAYLATGEYNVIVMDWRTIAKSLLYEKVAKSVPLIAEYMAEFIDFLRIHGDLNFSTTKLIGHSLGAHVVGLAARDAFGTIAEVVALDPAKPLFDSRMPGERVDASDAEHVQVIHTCAGRLGIKDPIGTSDFYPNGGQRQPGCREILGSCSHSRSYELFAESIKNPLGFRATHSYQQPMETEPVYMGGPTLDKNANGVYLLRTADQSPYALG